MLTGYPPAAVALNTQACYSEDYLLTMQIFSLLNAQQETNTCGWNLAATEMHHGCVSWIIFSTVSVEHFAEFGVPSEFLTWSKPYI